MSEVAAERMWKVAVRQRRVIFAVFLKLTWITLFILFLLLGALGIREKSILLDEAVMILGLALVYGIWVIELYAFMAAVGLASAVFGVGGAVACTLVMLIPLSPVLFPLLFRSGVHNVPPEAVILTFCMAPLVFLGTLLFVNAVATRELRRCGVKVGLLGAKLAELKEKLPF